jgi:broad specificity phosphatase PhoE
VATRIGTLKGVTAIYSSPLARARETATPVARSCQRALRIERGLIECDFGEWTGAKLSRLQHRPDWRIVQRYPSGFRFPGGESFPEMQTRIVSTIARLVQSHPGTTIVAVSHADPIKAAVAHALGIHLDLFQRIAIATASITAIAYRREGPTVLTVNSPAGDLSMLGVK